MSEFRGSLQWRIANGLFQSYARLGWSTGEPIDHSFIRRLEWRVVRRYLGLTGQESVCDVACGGGNWAKRLATEARITVGIDLDSETVQWAAKKATGTGPLFVCSDAQWLPFAWADERMSNEAVF